MSRRLRIEWRPGLKVTARLELAGDPRGPAVLLATGAGAGQDHPFLAGLRARLAARGHTAMTFDYPYREAGRRAPDRPEVLLACQRAAADRLRRYERRIVLAGKSMGGRMASHLAASGYPAVGLIVYGYPLVPIGASDPRPTDHLADVDMRMLFFQGARDRMAPLVLLEPVIASLRWAELRVVADADHSFSVPKRTGLDADTILDLLADDTARWLQGRTRPDS